MHWFKVVVFPKSAIRADVRITPNGPGDVGRQLDIDDANLAMGKPRGYDWSHEFGEPHTWHHDTRRGVMQLVPRELHHQTIPHIGGNKLWYL